MSDALPFKLSALIFLRDATGRLLMMRRNKAPNLGRWSPVGGKVETARGESPFECAVRETAEETGYVGGRATLLGTVAPNPAIQSNRAHFVLLEGVHLGATPAPDAHEELEVLVTDPRDALRAAAAEPATHALAFLALHRLQAARPELFA